MNKNAYLYLIVFTHLKRIHKKLIKWTTCRACAKTLQSCPTLHNPLGCSTPGFPVYHQLLELAQTHVHRVGNAIPPPHPLLSPCPPALNLSQHQGLSQWVNSSHQVARVSEYYGELLKSKHSIPLKQNRSQFSSVQFSRSVVSNSLRPHESQHTRSPGPSPTPGVHSDSRPSSP